jgi:hypothetical protein
MWEKGSDGHLTVAASGVYLIRRALDAARRVRRLSLAVNENFTQRLVWVHLNMCHDIALLN